MSDSLPAVNRSRRGLLVPVFFALVAYSCGAAVLWWQFVPRPRVAFGRGLVFGGFSPDGRHFVAMPRGTAGGRPGPIRVCETATGREVGRVADGESKGAHRVDLVPGGRSALLIRSGGWLLWDVEAGKGLVDQGTGEAGPYADWPVGEGRFSADGEALVVPRRARESDAFARSPTLLQMYGDLQVWDARSGELRAKIGGVHRHALARDGRTMVLAEAALPALMIPVPGGGVVIVRGATDDRPGGRWDEIQVLRRRDMATGRILETIPGWAGRVESLTISDDGRRIAAGTWAEIPKGDGDRGRGIVRLWDSGAHGGPSSLDPGPAPEPKVKQKTRSVPDVGFFGDGALAVRWKVDVPIPNRLRMNSSPFGELSAVPFHYTYGEITDLLVPTSNPVALWDLTASPPRRVEIPAHDMGFLSADGRSVAFWTARPASSVRVLELPSLRERWRSGLAMEQPIGLSPDGQWLMTIAHRPASPPRSGIGWLDRASRWLFSKGANAVDVVVRDAATGGRAGVALHRNLGNTYGFGLGLAARVTRPPEGLSALKLVPRSLARDGRTLAYPYWDPWVDIAGDEGFELWDLPPRRPWGWILGLPAVPPLLALLAIALIRRGRSRRLTGPPGLASAAPGR